MTATRRTFCIYFAVGNEMPLFRGEKPCYIWCYICWNFWVENFWATGSAPKRKPPKKRYGIRTPWQYRWKWYARSWKTWDIDHKYVWRVKALAISFQNCVETDCIPCTFRSHNKMSNRIYQAFSVDIKNPAGFFAALSIIFFRDNLSLTLRLFFLWSAINFSGKQINDKCRRTSRVIK